MKRWVNFENNERFGKFFKKFAEIFEKRIKF